MNEEEKKLTLLKEDFLQKRLAAERAAYAYCCEVPVGPERTYAFEMYERQRRVTYRYQ